MLDGLSLGFGVALTSINLLYCLLGVTIGTLVGVLPGIGPVVTLSMLLPLTFGLPPIAALIMLAGIYYGAAYGGSTTAILVNVPGETSAVVTTLDGYAMARAGRAGAALAIAAIGSFFAGTIGTLIVALFAQPLADAALAFGPADYFSLMLLGLLAAAVLAKGSLLKAAAMIVLGLLMGVVGTDVNSGTPRFTFGMPELLDGLSFVGLALGLFGLAEIVSNLERRDERIVFMPRTGRLMPTGADLGASRGAILRGTAIGAFFGILPGAGGAIGAFSSYAVEKRLAKDPSRFGRGAIEGVAGPESANNSAAQTAFIPTLILGIPGSGTMAVFLGAMMIQGIAPGPNVMSERPELVWGLIASMWIGNLFLVVLNLPLIGIWIRLLHVPYRLLFPAILFFSGIGAYSVNNNTFDVVLAAGFGLLGYVFMKLDCEPAPLLLGFVLGPMLEENFRRALLLSRGDPVVFVTEPISLALVLAALGLMLLRVPGFGKRFQAMLSKAS